MKIEEKAKAGLKITEAVTRAAQLWLLVPEADHGIFLLG